MLQLKQTAVYIYVCTSTVVRRQKQKRRALLCVWVVCGVWCVVQESVVVSGCIIGECMGEDLFSLIFSTHSLLFSTL